MPTLRNESTRNRLIQRLHNLTPDSHPQWGTLDAPRMICHLGDTLAMGLGDVRTPSVNANPILRFVLKYLIFYVMPMPKGLPTTTELLATPPASFEADRLCAIQLIARLAATPCTLGPTHPFFGPLTNDEWNVLQWKHIDHHLKQFGL
jgi:hypothetical protein